MFLLNVDDSDLNADWIKTLRWDLPTDPEALRSLFGDDWAAQLSRLPAWLAAPAEVKAAAESTLVKHGDPSRPNYAQQHPGSPSARRADIVPDALKADVDSAVQRLVSGADELDVVPALARKAASYGMQQGLSSTDSPHGQDASSAALYGSGMARIALDRAKQETEWAIYRSTYADRVKTDVDDLRLGGRVMVKVPDDAVEGILADGVKNQFQTQTSRGSLNAPSRAVNELAHHGIMPNAPADTRPVYGFVSRDGDEHPVSVSQYGEVTLVLRDDVRTRTTVTVGDSLNSHATPIPLNGPVTARQVADASANTPFMDAFYAVQRDGYRAFGNVGRIYMEAQIMGGVKRSDIERIVFQDGVRSPSEIQALAERLAPDGIIVEVAAGARQRVRPARKRLQPRPE